MTLSHDLRRCGFCDRDSAVSEWEEDRCPRADCRVSHRIRTLRAAIDHVDPTKAPATPQKLTADTIYDHQIDALVREFAEAKEWTIHGLCVIATHDQPTPIRAVYAARELCAAILNAREANKYP